MPGPMPRRGATVPTDAPSINVTGADVVFTTPLQTLGSVNPDAQSCVRSACTHVSISDCADCAISVHLFEVPQHPLFD